MSNESSTSHQEMVGYSTLGGIILGVLLSLCTLTCIAGNIIALKYFLSHRKTPSAISYILISFNDLILLVLLVPLQLALFTGTSHIRGPTGCSIWTFIWTISRRMTNFLVTWILACRIVTLMYQFKYLRAANIYIPTLCYLAVLTIQGVVPIALGGYSGECGDLSSTKSPFQTSYSALEAVYLTLDVLEFVLPIIADVFMVVSALVFIKSGNQVLGKMHVPGLSTKTKVTITVLIIASLHVFLNLPHLVYIFITYPSNSTSHNISYLKLVVMVILPILNCISNIAVYFTRMVALRIKLIQAVTLSKVYGGYMTDWLKMFCHENNRVVPASTLVLGGSDPSSEREEPATGAVGPVRQMKSIELTENVDAWFDSELAGEEQRRYFSYLYNGENGGVGEGKGGKKSKDKTRNGR